MEVDAVGLRVLGCLIEKQRTTPEAYPLSLNALRAACNQATNRDPVVDYDEPAIRAALEQLSRSGWVRLASGRGSRVAKYRHLLSETLELADEELALLAVLMLRGPQTLGELKQRSERLHRFGSLEEVERTLDGLAARELAARLPRQPGQKEERYTHLLSNEQEEPRAVARTEAASSPAIVSGGVPAAEDDRLAELERELRELRAEVAELRTALLELEARGA